jgi:hypothetical protein
MKKLLASLFLLTPFFVISQNYIPIPADSTSEWRVKKMYHFKAGICLYIDDIKYYFAGDTTINNRTYSKLYKSGITYQEAMGPNTTCDSTVYHFTDVYMGAIRNDRGKVFYQPPFNDPEILLYDFTLNIGNTLLRPWVENSLSTIVAIDTVIINNQQHRRFFINSDTANANYIDSSSYITEGIGASTGLIENQNWEGSNELLCYAENHNPIYPIGCSCILNVSIKKVEKNSQKESLQIYPNPAREIITLKFTNATNGSLVLNIYDIMGKQVKQFQIPNAKLEYKAIIKWLKTGLYFYKIVNKDGIIYSGKIIKE